MLLSLIIKIVELFKSAKNKDLSVEPMNFKMSFGVFILCFVVDGIFFMYLYAWFLRIFSDWYFPDENENVKRKISINIKESLSNDLVITDFKTFVSNK